MPHRLFSTKPIGELHEADDSGNELSRTLDARAGTLQSATANTRTTRSPRRTSVSSTPVT